MKATSASVRLAWRALAASCLAWAATALMSYVGIVGSGLPAPERMWTVLSASLGANPGAVTLACVAVLTGIPGAGAVAGSGRCAFAGLVVGAGAASTVVLAALTGFFRWFFHDPGPSVYTPLVLGYVWAVSGLPLWSFLAAFTLGPGRDPTTPYDTPSHTRARPLG